MPNPLAHPEPIALYNPADMRTPLAYLCSVCKHTAHTTAYDVEYAKRHASLCCSTMCDTCHGPKPVRGYCEACRRASEQEQEQAQYDKATKLAPDAYDGPVYNPFTDRFDSNVGEALERVEEDEGEPPSYLWACHVSTAHLDPDDIVTQLVEEMHEDYEVDDYDGLAAFCKEWNAKQAGASWAPDYSRVIVLGGSNA